MKTAKIDVYHVFGTKNSYGANVLYRGKVLKSFHSGRLARADLYPAAELWAHANGFSHVRPYAQN